MELEKLRVRIKRMIVKSKAVLKDKNRKNISKIMKETTIIAVKRRCLPTHYFSHFIYRKGIENYLDYLTGKEANKIHQALSTPDTAQVLDNKLLFYEHYSKLGLPVPRQLAFNYNYLWFIEKNDGLIKTEVRSRNEFLALMISIFKDSKCDAVFAKPIRFSGGSGATNISHSTFASAQSEKIGKLFNHIISGCFIIQETIIQHPDMIRLNSSSLNTIRIDTYNSFSSSPEVISALLRIGRAGSPVDNTMSGGLFIGIDMETGKLRANAFEGLERGGRVYSRHPDSGYEFNEFTIPYFSEVKEIARQAASSLAYKLVGWDIGISTTGPVLIEGNSRHELHDLDVLYGGYRRHPIFKKAMKEAGIKVED
jgi:hypothetical protein